ncbi:MAG: Nif3-like dinuclear metal center hexameric protein [Bacteroidia bacterium]|nr:Nif3-like dinuclear metal center hexameric protein [Bacteroidia bacterium]
MFSGLKKLNGSNYIERTVILAIQHNIAIYAIHTNLDNVKNGVNHQIALRLGLNQTRILQPKSATLSKLQTYVPHAQVKQVLDALFNVGAGKIGNYSHCSFRVNGEGTFKALEGANPFVGQMGEVHTEAEAKVEVVFPSYLRHKLVQTLFEVHPYEEVAYDIFSLVNENQEIGSGLIGQLERAMEPTEFLAMLKEKMELSSIRYTEVSGKKIERVAVCGGAGSFLLKQAIASGADAFVSADFKYHEFFDAENRLMIADIGHYESEKFTKSLIYELILKKFPTFAILLSKTNTNPVNYYS